MTDGADLYLKAMLEAVEAGECVDWNGVSKVVSEATQREADAAEVGGYEAEGFYAEAAYY